LKRTKSKKGSWAAAVLHQERGIRAGTVRVLQQTDGVELVTPNWLTSMLTIVYDPTLLYLDDLRRIIKEGNNRGETARKP
jgi:hypothetical protein